jgi:hypothetical protein
MIIKFLDLGGEFCTRRTSEAIPRIKALIEKALLNNENIVCDWTGVKILTPSFIDEIIPELIIKYGATKIQKHVSFRPVLTGFLSHQVERGVKNRSEK